MQNGSWPLISIVIINAKGTGQLERCLRSVLKADYPEFEVIIVDCLTKGIETWKKNFPQVKLIHFDYDIGPSACHNVGVQASNLTSKYVIFLDNDTEVQPDFIKRLVEVAELDKKVGSVGCRIVQYNGRTVYGPKFTYKGFIVGAYSRETYNQFGINLANCGCAILCRKSVYIKIGGYDPYFWMNWDDHDFGYRLNLAGYQSVYTPNTMVCHVGGGTSKKVTSDRQARVIRNVIVTYVKNYELKNLIMRLPFFILFLTIHNLLSAFKNRQNIPRLHGVLRAYLMLLRDLRLLVTKRVVVQKLRQVSDNSIFLITKEKTIKRLRLWRREFV